MSSAPNAPKPPKEIPHIPPLAPPPQAVPARKTMAQTFDGPPTIKRSGSEHRVGRFSPSLLRREGWGERWSLP